MKRFDHRNIVKLLGVCTRNEPVYTVMEYMLYGDLKTYLLARRHLVTERHREELDEVSNKRLTSMAYDVANGLAFLHEQNMSTETWPAGTVLSTRAGPSSWPTS